MARKRVVLDEADGERFDRMMREQPELDLGQPPIDWYELSGMFARREELWLAVEENKREGKILKAEYEESQANIVAAGRRVRARAQQERAQIGMRALANRRVDPATGRLE